MNIGAGGQIHHRVCTPARRPDHLLDFFFDGRGDRGVADIGVDLDQEIAADDHRLGFRMIDIRRNNRAPARHFIADKFRGDEFGDRCAKTVAGMGASVAVGTVFQRLLCGRDFRESRCIPFPA